MAKDSRLVSIGDVITVDVPVKAHAKLLITSYQEDIVGIATSSRDVYREFRVTEDGIFWTDWAEMTPDNLSYRYFTVNGVATIQLRYTRIGTDSSGVIEWNSITFGGEAVPINYDTPTIDDSIFADVFPSYETQKLAANLFKKLYFRGVVPKYIVRGDNRDAVEDADYISLARAIGHFFAMFIQYFKRFDNFYNDEQLMREYVRQYGVYFDEANATLEDLQYLTSHLYDEIRKRGTAMIFKRKGDTLPNGETVPIDGEFIRLLRSKDYNELIYEILGTEMTGLCVGKSSPMYRGTNYSNRINKTAEDTADFQDLDHFLVTSDGGAVRLIDFEDKRVVQISVSGQQEAGLGNYQSTREMSRGYVVDSEMDYEVCFFFRVPAMSGNATLRFGVEGYDFNKQKLYDAFITADNNSVKEDFLSQDTGVFVKNEWYMVRGYLYAYSTNIIANPLLNIGRGKNLTFNNRFVRYIQPYIQLRANGDDSKIMLWDYKIRPAVRGTNIMPLKNGVENSHSLGFVECPPIFYLYARNNNNSQSEEDIKNIVDKYLLPYNVTTMLQLLNNYI